MKLKQRDWILIAIVVVLVALVWKSGGFREGFTGNPIPSQADIQSAGGSFSGGHFTPSGTPTYTMTAMVNWFKTNAPWPTGTTDNDILGLVSWPIAIAYGLVFNNNPQPFINFIQSMPSGGSVSDNVTKIVNFVNTTYPSKEPLRVDDFLPVVNQGQKPSPQTKDDINLYYWFYVYVFGKPGSSPSIPATSSTPSPASSSSTQPMTLSVPSPCRPEYKSIPGGSMEFKCFN